MRMPPAATISARCLTARFASALQLGICTPDSHVCAVLAAITTRTPSLARNRCLIVVVDGEIRQRPAALLLHAPHTPGTPWSLQHFGCPLWPQSLSRCCRWRRTPTIPGCTIITIAVWLHSWQWDSALCSPHFAHVCAIIAAGTTLAQYTRRLKIHWCYLFPTPR